MSAVEDVRSCAACGATIYPEHLQRKTTDVVDGKLLCSFCLSNRRAGGKAASDEEDVLLLDDDAAGSTVAAAVKPGMAVESRPTTAKIQLSSQPHKERTYQRPLLKDSPHATRCKTFHCKLSDAPLVHLNEQINEWVDARPEVEIKFATTTVGVVEGKHNDPHMLITVFY